MTYQRKEEIGDCTLYLGDCREVLPTLSPLQSIVSDPPYGMAFRSNHRAEKHLAIANDADDELLRWACSLEVSHSKYLFCRWDNIGAVPKPRSLITWVKNNWSMGDLEHEHARQTEVALFYPGGGALLPSRASDRCNRGRSNLERAPSDRKARKADGGFCQVDGRRRCRSFYGQRHDRRRLPSAASLIRGGRDRTDALRYGLPTRGSRDARAANPRRHPRYVCRASQAGKARTGRA